MDRESLLIRSLLSPKASQRGSIRRVSSMVDKMNRINLALKEIKDEERSERATLQQLLSQGQDLSQKTRENIDLCQSIKGAFGKNTGLQSTKVRLQSATTIDKSATRENHFPLGRENLDHSKSRGSSLEKDRSGLVTNIKMPMTPGNSSTQLKNLALFKRNKSIEDLDRIIGQALKDLKQPKQHQSITKIQKISSKKDLSINSRSTSIKNKKKQDNTLQILMVLLSMIILMIVISKV